MNYAHELEQACDFARRAGDTLLRVYETHFGYELKGEVDPVTEADRLANTYLVNALRSAFPTDGVVAEESADISDALDKTRCWYVDPLDGTKEFIKKNGEFSVMVGLAVEGRSVLGVVYQPVTDKLYTGIPGVGAALSAQGDTRSLRVSDVGEAARLRLVTSRSHRSEGVDQIVSALGIEHQAVSGSVGLKVGLIAEQVADLYVHLSDRSCAWDACAPEAILRAAGGCFTDLAGRPFMYGGTDMRSRHGILACNTAAFDAVLPVVQSVAKAANLI